MKRNLMALPGMLALVLACGEGRTSDQDTGAESGALPADTGMAGGVEDTTAAPSTDLGTPSKDTAADTGSAVGGDTVGTSGDTVGTSGYSPQ
jgi:hypothetical protein